jgi:hypothetical protein
MKALAYAAPTITPSVAGKDNKSMFKLIGAAMLMAGVSAMIGVPASHGPSLSASAVILDGQAPDIRARNFLLPQPLGDPLPFCLVDESQCGKPAADAFCRRNGYGEALTFLRDGMQPDLASVQFRQIKCWHPVTVGSSKLILNDQY